jgi:hypothetical protein
MSLRSFSAALLAASLFASPALAQSEAPKAVTHDYDWVFVYYMAYDNNLEACGRPIIDMLKEGITNDRTLITVHADWRNAEGMERYILTQGNEKKIALDEEGIAEEEVLASELAWVKDNYKAKKYGLIFLNHGGKLGEMSYDERPGEDRGQNWLYPPQVAKVLVDWRKSLPGEMELMFYQQCGKGTLENYYEMKDVANFVMGSQTVVGAPNYYYTKAVQDVCKNPDIDGAQLAKLFTNHETPNMFTTYTTYSADALQELPGKLNAALEPLLAKEELELFKVTRQFNPCFKFEPDELMFDGIAMLEELYKANGIDTAPVATFKEWVDTNLITSHRVSPLRERQAGSWCGFSIYLPTRPQAYTRYSNDYAIYSATKLGELQDKLLKAIATARAKRAAPKASTPK